MILVSTLFSVLYRLVTISSPYFGERVRQKTIFVDKIYDCPTIYGYLLHITHNNQVVFYFVFHLVLSLFASAGAHDHYTKLVKFCTW